MVRLLARLAIALVTVMMLASCGLALGVDRSLIPTDASPAMCCACVPTPPSSCLVGFPQGDDAGAESDTEVDAGAGSDLPEAASPGKETEAAAKPIATDASESS